MKLVDRLFGPAASESRHSIKTIDDYFGYLGNTYPLGIQTSMSNLSEEPNPTGFDSYANQVFKGHPVVFGAERFRMAVFSQGRYRWRNRKTYDLIESGPGASQLRLLEKPWPAGNTSDLNARMLLHGDLGGNAYMVRPEPDLITFLRPDWCSIVLGSTLNEESPALAPDARFVGVMFSPPLGGDARFYPANEVAHFAPIPDPTAHFRGMSWLTPIIRELRPDMQATEYKMKFFTQGATPNFALKADPSVTVEQLRAFKEMIEEESGGLANAFKTLYLGGGMDPVPIGNSFKDMDFSSLQGKAETRILMAAGVHAVLVGASEGMQGSALNAGNYKQVRRNFSDVDLQNLFNQAASSLETLLTVPPSGELVVDQRNIPFLQDDAQDQADIQMKQASAITTLVRDGFEADSAVKAVTTNDMRKLVHTGKTSVQLQEPTDPTATTNSNDGGST